MRVEQLRKTRLEPYLAMGGPFAGGYHRGARRLQRAECVETLRALTAAGITPTTFKVCEMFEPYSRVDSFGLMADVDTIGTKTI